MAMPPPAARPLPCCAWLYHPRRVPCCRIAPHPQASLSIDGHCYKDDAAFISARGLEACVAAGELGRGGLGVVDKVELLLPSGATLVAARKRVSTDQYSAAAFKNELEVMDACSSSDFFVKYYASSSSSTLSPTTHHELLLLLYHGSLQDELVSCGSDMVLQGARC